MAQLTKILKGYGSGNQPELFLITLIGAVDNQIICKLKIAFGCGQIVTYGMIFGVIFCLLFNMVFQKHNVKSYLIVNLKIYLSECALIKVLF